jgi:hypothetical protein
MERLGVRLENDQRLQGVFVHALQIFERSNSFLFHQFDQFFESSEQSRILCLMAFEQFDQIQIDDNHLFRSRRFRS